MKLNSCLICLSVCLMLDSPVRAQADSSERFAYGGLFSLLGLKAVHSDLGLDEDAVAKLLDAKHRFNRAWFEAGGGMRTETKTYLIGLQTTFQEAAMPPKGLQGLAEMSEEERQKKIEKMMGTWKSLVGRFQPALKDALTAEQYTRLQQIYLQALGVAAFTNSEVVQSLGITKDQQHGIEKVIEEFKVAERLRQRQNNEIDIDSERDARSELDRKINEMLTKIQIETLDVLKGKKFDVELLNRTDPNAIDFGRAKRPR